MAAYVADLKLVERMLAGDAEAFDLFGERFFAAAYRYTLNRMGGDRDAALEVAQTAMTKALSKLGTYRGEAALTTWLCACCRNEILMGWRRRRGEPIQIAIDDEAEAVELREPAEDAEHGLLRKERSLLVHMTLDALPAHYSRALEWMYVERLPVREIASRLGVQPKAAESLLTRARQAFRDSYTAVRLGTSS